MAQSGYFRLVTTVALCIGIIDAKLLLCHGISDKSRDNIIQMRELNDRTFMNDSKPPFQLIMVLQL